MHNDSPNQALAQLLSELKRLESGQQIHVEMDMSQYRAVIYEAAVYILNRRRHCDDALWEHLCLSAIDCIKQLLDFVGNQDAALLVLDISNDIKRRLVEAPKPDYSFFYGQHNSTLPHWPGVPQRLIKLVMNLLAVHKQSKPRDQAFEKRRCMGIRYMDSDLMFLE